MKATVIEVRHPNEHMSPRLFVQLRRGKVEQVDTFGRGELFDQLAEGDEVEVIRKTNSPYVYIAV